jgi:hypothetical protein
MVRALAPFLAAQWLLLLIVMLVPGVVHFGQREGEISRAPARELSDEEINRTFKEMIPPASMPDSD